jgi:hypothetical protein
MTDTCILQLGRWGDIINVLPLVHMTSYPIVVGKGFESLAKSIDYARVVPVPVDATDFQGGLAVAKRMFKNVRAAQVNNHTPPDFSLPHGFMEQAYRNAGAHREFLAGHFNRIPAFTRDKAAEVNLTRRVLGDWPVVKPILVCTSGFSSPFPYAALVLGTVRRFAGGHPVVDISQVRAEKFTDMLGLFDAARALVTIDTGVLHLAGAHGKIPYFAFLQDRPNPWYKGYCRGNVRMRCGYTAAPNQLQLIQSFLQRL